MSEKSVNKKDDKDIVQQSIKMAYAGVVDEPVPSWMVSAITSPLRRGLINGALAVAVLSIGIGLGMMLKGLTTSDEPVVVAELNASDLGSQVHDLFTMDPVDPVQISADDPDFLNLWVSHRLKRKFELPDLSAHGLTALGARMVQDGNRAAVLNVFEDRDQNRFSLLDVSTVLMVHRAMRGSVSRERRSVWNGSTVNWCMHWLARVMSHSSKRSRRT